MVLVDNFGFEVVDLNVGDAVGLLSVHGGPDGVFLSFQYCTVLGLTVYVFEFQ